MVLKWKGSGGERRREGGGWAEGCIYRLMYVVVDVGGWDLFRGRKG